MWPIYGPAAVALAILLQVVACSCSSQIPCNRTVVAVKLDYHAHLTATVRKNRTVDMKALYLCKHCVLLMTQMKNRIFIVMSMKLSQIYQFNILMVFTF